MQKKRIKYWHVLRTIYLTLPVSILVIAFYLIITKNHFIYSIYLSSISGLLFRYFFVQWNGLKKDILLSQIEI